MRPRAWQIGLFVVAIVALSMSIWWNTRPAISLARRVRMIDVTTGEIVVLSSGKQTLCIPEKNKRTDKYALVPIHKNKKDGKWHILPQYKPDLKNVEGEITAVDRESGEVLVEVGES